MKKVFITLMAVLSLAAFTACSNSDDEAAVETTDAVTTSEEADTTVTETEAETTEVETTEAETTAAETETEDAFADGEIFKGTGYTLTINSSKWINAVALMDAAAQNAEGLEAMKESGLTAEDLKSMVDCMYYYIDDSGTNFNVTVTDAGMELEASQEILELYLDIIKNEYNSMTGFILNTCEIVTVNDNMFIKSTLSVDESVSASNLKMETYFTVNGTKQITVTLTIDPASAETAPADFEAVLNTISFE